MSNFTKCCSSLLSLQNKGKAALMLFMFLALTSLSYAQGTGANNTGGGEEIGDINGCMHEVPAMKPVSELMAPGYFDGFFDACHDSDEEFVIHPVAPQQGVYGEWGVATGFAKGSTHCSWTYYYVYSVKCAGEVTPFTVKYNGGDATAPWVPKQNKAAYNALIADKLDLDLCFDNRPIAPSADDIAALYTDNCEHVKVSGELVSKRTKTKNDDCGWIEIHVYTVKDYCDDNAFEFSITYSGSDQSAPEFDDKAIEGLKDITVDCDKIPDAVSIPYTDNCAPSGKAKLYEEQSTIVPGQECAGGVIERWWKATDECGNNAWHKQTITVRPAKQAVFNEPQNMSISCEDRNNFEGLIPDLYYTNGMEGACEISGYAKPEYTAPDSNCASFEVKYSFIDNCGREIIETMTVTVYDNVPPAFINAAEDLTVECDGEGNVEDYNNWLANFGNAEAQDNCTATEDLVWSHNADGRLLTDECGETGEITVIFTVTDSCGNPSKTYATFKIVDTLDPETTPAYNQTVVCDGEGNVDQFEAWLADNGGATAKDDCSDVTWTNDFPGNLKDKDFDMADYLKEGCSEYTGYINVIFTVTDACGNDVDLPATFTIEDSIAPEVTPAQDMTVECDSTIIVISGDEVDTENGGYAGTNAYKFLNWLATNGGATATDGCSAVSWKYDIVSITGDACAWNIRVKFTASDECGNETSTYATFTIQDTLSPMIGQEAQDLVVECGQEHTCDEQRGGCYTAFDHWLHTNGGAQALDMCDKDLTWTNDWDGKELTDECGNTGRVTITFTVTDDCGLSSATAAEFRIVDTTAPSLSIPEDVVLELDEKCEADTTPANTGYARGWDACGNATVTYTDVTNKQDCVTTIIRTWKATDECGLVTAKDQKITLIDKLAPVYTGNVGQFNLSNYDACEAPAAPAEQDIADQFEDACGHVIATLVDTITISEDTCDWAVQFVYEVADNCGNVYDGTVKVTYWGSDQTAPNLMDGEKLPEGVSGINACLADALEANPAVADHAIEKIFEDNCGQAVSAKSERTITEDGCKWAFHYTYTVTDECGNETSFNQYFSGEDNTAPELIGTIPSDMSDLDACKDTYEGPSEAEIKALFHDSCGVNVVKSTHRSGTDCNWLNSFEYTVTDNCGNAYPSFKITYTGRDQSIPEVDDPYKLYTVNMSDYPNVACPDDVELGLTEGQTLTQDETFNIFGIADIDLSLTNATDNCTPAGDIKFNITSVVKGGDACRVVFTVAYTVEDNCGNTTQEYNKFFRLVDDIAPVIDEAPEDITVQCIEDVPAMISLNWVDNCQGSGTVEGEDGKLVGDTCGGTITRTWNIKDACGNEAVTRTQIITIKDSIKPEFTFTPADVTVECDESTEPSNTGTALATDNCTIPTVTYTDEVSTGNSDEESENNSGEEVTLVFEDFEDDALTYTPSVADDVDELATEDYFGRVNNADLPSAIVYNNVQGNSFYTAHDTDGTSSGNIDNLQLNWTGINITDVTNLKLAIKLAEDDDGSNEDWDANSSVKLQVQIDGGGFYSVLAVESEVGSDGNETNEKPRLDTDFDGVGDGTEITDVFTEFISSLPDGGSILDIRITIDFLESGDEDIAIDDVKLTGEKSNSESLCADKVITRTWRATDACGNVSTSVQVITVVDSTNPTASNPADINVECASEVPSPDPSVVLDEADNCSTPTVTWVKDESDNGSCPETITRTYKVEDACGNSIEVEQKIIIKDETAPTLVVPQNVTVQCDAIPAPPSIDSLEAQATDNCDGDVQVLYLGESPRGDTGCYTFTRYWKAIDACGNETNKSQEITVIDNTAPVIDCPNDVDFGNSTPVFATSVNYTDNCSDDGVSSNYSDQDLTPELVQQGGQGGLQSVTFRCNGIYDYVFNNYSNETFNGRLVFRSYNYGANLALYYSTYYGRWLVYDYNYSYYPWYAQQSNSTNPPCSMSSYVNNTNCSSVEVICNYETLPSTYKHTKIRTFTASDDCGNSDTCEVTYTWLQEDNSGSSNSSSNNGGSGNEEDFGTIPCSIIDNTLDFGDKPENPNNGSSSAANDDEEGLNFKAYPVPFNKDVTIEYNFEFDTEVTIEVYDTKGLLVVTKKVAYKAGYDAKMPLRINGSDQMYYVKLITNKGTVTKKILASKL